MPHGIVVYPNRSNGETLHYATLEELDIWNDGAGLWMRMILSGIQALGNALAIGDEVDPDKVAYC